MSSTGPLFTTATPTHTSELLAHTQVPLLHKHPHPPTHTLTHTHFHPHTHLCSWLILRYFSCTHTHTLTHTHTHSPTHPHIRAPGSYSGTSFAHTPTHSPTHTSVLPAHTQVPLLHPHTHSLTHTPTHSPTCIELDMVSLSESISERFFVPSTLRSVVWASRRVEW